MNGYIGDDFGTMLESKKEQLYICQKAIDVIGSVSRYIQERCPAPVSGDDRARYVEAMSSSVEDTLRRKLTALIPGSGFIGEDTSSPAFLNWVVDPIDGTNNFLNGFPFAISVALMDESLEHAYIGIVKSVLDDAFYCAVDGEGAFSRIGNRTRPMNVKGTTASSSEISLFGMPVDKSKAERMLGYVLKAYDGASDMKRIGPPSLDICRVAAGMARFYFALDLKPCDVAAGSLILTEAGGHIVKRDDLYVFSAVDIDGDGFPTDIFG